MTVQTQKAEFDAAKALSEALRAHDMTPVVDDDYPEVRHRYESALAELLRTMRENGRFEPGNQYGLKEVVPVPAELKFGDSRDGWFYYAPCPSGDMRNVMMNPTDIMNLINSTAMQSKVENGAVWVRAAQ
jgi:hypothetical protein